MDPAYGCYGKGRILRDRGGLVFQVLECQRRGLSKWGILKREAKVGIGVHWRYYGGGIPKEGNIKSDDIKTIRWNPGGGAKVSMGVQRRCLEGA